MDWEKVRILRIFHVNSEKLREAVKKHIPKKTTIKYRVNEPIGIEGEIDVTVEAGLASSARLFLGDNTSNFDKVVNILLNYHQDDNQKVSRLREYKKVWKKIFGPHVLFRIGTEEDDLTNRNVFDMIVNGSHLHSDISKFDKNFELQQTWTYPLLRIQLQSLISDIRKLTTMLSIEFVEPILELSSDTEQYENKDRVTR
jgi:hypothetical protein